MEFKRCPALLATVLHPKDNVTGRFRHKQFSNEAVQISMIHVALSLVSFKCQCNSVDEI